MSENVIKYIWSLKRLTTTVLNALGFILVATMSNLLAIDLAEPYIFNRGCVFRKTVRKVLQKIKTCSEDLEF